MPRTPIPFAAPDSTEAFLEGIVIAAAYRTARGSHYANGWIGAIYFLFAMPDHIWASFNIRLGGTAGAPLNPLSALS